MTRVAFDPSAYPGQRHDLTCPECGAPMELKPSRFGVFYGCVEWRDSGCRGSHGAHPDGAPLGVPATTATKSARIAAHEAFDAWWRDRGMRREDAYAVLRRSMGLGGDAAHIGAFSIDQCQHLIAMIAEERRITG